MNGLSRDPRCKKFPCRAIHAVFLLWNRSFGLLVEQLERGVESPKPAAEGDSNNRAASHNACGSILQALLRCILYGKFGEKSAFSVLFKANFCVHGGNSLAEFTVQRLVDEPLSFIHWLARSSSVNALNGVKEGKLSGYVAMTVFYEESIQGSCSCWPMLESNVSVCASFESNLNGCALAHCLP